MDKIIFDISGRKVGPSFKPLIIPEIGINHNGSIEKAFKIVDAAKNAGAEIIKHQTHLPEDEMSEEAKKIKPGNSKKFIFDIIQSCSLTKEDEFKLYQYIKKKKLKFLSTPFSREAADYLDKLGVNTFKIGSGEVTNEPFIDYLCSLKKNLIISTGMVDINYLKKLKKKLNKKKIKFAFLHTTSLYPCPDNLVRLNAIDEMKSTFKDTLIGYSDHSISNLACYAAISKGAVIIEKHFVDNLKTKGPDIICSCDEKSLRELILNSDRLFTQMKGKKNFLKEEQVTRNFAFASVVSTKQILKGEILNKNNIWIKRPGNGDFKANQLKSLIGKKAKRNIKKNFQIRKNDI